MAAAVQTRTAGEKSVAVGNLAHVFVGAARRDNGSGGAVFPQVYVLRRIKRHNPLARGTGSGLDANAVFQRNRQQPVGIRFLQI